IVRPEWMPLESDGSAQQAIFRDVFGRNGTVADDLSTIPALAHFHYVVVPPDSELAGLTSWFRPPLFPLPSGVTYRARAPGWGFRWVLTHEMGHYWGLDHGATRAMDEIMYTPRDVGVVITADTVFEYALFGGEPRFTLDDVRAVWSWMTGDAA